MDDEELKGVEEEEPKPPKMEQVKCNYCGNIVELRNVVSLNPKTEEYEYACENCAKRLELDLYKEDSSQIG
jgi:DNA-directed RNA polymerase subunit RPC12/RpoP